MTLHSLPLPRTSPLKDAMLAAVRQFQRALSEPNPITKAALIAAGLRYLARAVTLVDAGVRV